MIRAHRSQQVREGDILDIDKGEIDGIGAGRYLVEKAEWGGGGTGHGPHDVYPDGWQVNIRRLAADDFYKPTNKASTFYQKTNCIGPSAESVLVVGKMKKSVRWDPVD